MSKTSKFLEENYSKIIDLFFRYTIPTVKKMYLQEADASWLPEIIANLCLCASGPTFEELFKFFVNYNCKNIQ